jgi:hypothetical protein
MIQKTHQEVEEEEKNLDFCHPSHSLALELMPFSVPPFLLALKQWKN